MNVAPEHIRTVVRGLTKAQRMYVRDGSIHGNCSMRTVRALKQKGLFHLVIDSPNGQCGFMRLTALGEAVSRAMTRAAPLAELSREEFCARFKARMLAAAGDDGETVEYADQAGPSYWEDGDQRAGGPEDCADADMSYWGGQ